MRKVVAAFILIILMLNLTSCYDAIEINNMLHVVAIGVDRGVSDKWRLTLQFPTIKGSGGGSQSSGGGGQEEYTHVTIDAPSFFAGINMLNASLPRRLTFMHAQIIVFSEELAKSGLIDEYITSIHRFREIRQSAHMLIVKGKADEFLKENEPFIGNLVAKSFQMLINESNNTGFFPRVTLEDFYSGLKSSYRQPIATLTAINDFKSFQKEGEPWETGFKTGGDYIAGKLPRIGKNKIELFGTALFDGGTMVGELSGDETRYMLMVRDEFERGFFTMKDPKEQEMIIALDVRGPTKPKIKVTLDDTVPVIHLKMHLNADILAIQSGVNYEHPKLKVLLEKEFQQIIKNGIEKVVRKCQNLNTDVFMFGDHAIKNFLTIDDLENYNWNSHFEDAKVTVEVKVAIRRTGTQIDGQLARDTERDE
ncbi:MAG: Ger(x)C family spore germination protein [Clostridiales bacterium]|jgi:spore germination protein KC|nr:Ger(x)C family spore germination protein [Clostridiales bacterium]